MTDDERLLAALRTALPPVAAEPPARDLWPQVLSRCQAPAGCSWLDLSLAALAAALLLMFPDGLWLLVYHM